MHQTTCRQRLKAELRERLNDIRKLWHLYLKNPDSSDAELGKFNEYGLSFDYVPKETFPDQKRGYFRWQLSWGGPADEFRFYLDEDLDAIEIEYWYLDWFDGAGKRLHRDSFSLLKEIFDYLKELGLVKIERDKTIISG